VLITTANPYAESSKSLEGRHTKVYYTDQISVDTLRSLITRTNLVTNSCPWKIQEKDNDTFARLDVYKIIGAAQSPLYVEGSNCLKLFGSWGYLGKSAAANAMFYLMLRCRVKSWRNDVEVDPETQIRDPYHILKDKSQ
jgi:hypothetical protein